MNPNAAASFSPRGLVTSIWRNRSLIFQLTRREVVGRYKGSFIGLMWSFLHPLLMLSVYTFVFSVMFKSRWQGDTGVDVPVAVVLFVGMTIHGLFAEVVGRAPNLIVDNTNFVKKVIFPLEILPIVSLMAALFHFAVSSLIVLGAAFLFRGGLPWTAFLTPLVIAPLAVFTLGVAWLLASLGVFVRDMGQTIGIVVTAMLFLAPVFFPVSAMPAEVQPLAMLNPLTIVIEQARAVLLWGQWPDWSALGLYSVMAVAVACLGFAWFQLTRKGFADVL